MFNIGEVVKWNGSLWIVSNSTLNRVWLVSMSSTNCSACVSDTFPGPLHRIDSIIRIATSVQNYIYDNIRGLFPGLPKPT